MANKDMLIRVNADTKNYDAQLAKATKTLDNFKKSNLSMGGIINQSTAALTSMAASVMGVTAALGAAQKVFSSMVNINKQFEQSSANLAAVMGTSKDQITDLTQQAKTLGATTQYTATQILELQANLARLGFNQEEILNSTKSVQAMATAMGADLGEAANLAGAALRGFGMNASEMERVASVLSVGTTKSALSFEKLATALPIVQTAAAKTGFTIEDTVAMLGKLTDNGINAASAATQLRKILNDSTTAGTKLANALGGPVKSFDELVLALDKASRSGQNHADSVALVNSKNATALDILRDMSVQREVDVNGVKKQTSALQDLRESITDCAEGMRGMQDEQLNTLQGSITILGSAWEGLMLTFSESNGVIKSVVDSLSELLQSWTRWRNRNKGGDAAVKQEELGLTEESKKEADAFIETEKASGKSADAITEDANKKIEALEKEANALMELEKAYKKWEKEYKLYANSSDVEKALQLQQQNPLIGTAYYGKGKKDFGEIYKDIAGYNDQIAQQKYIISAVTPAKPIGGEAGGEDDGLRGTSKIALLKAQYEEEEKMRIASLDRMNMEEADYEARVYEIRRETLQKIADLYQDETKEKAQAMARLHQLDIQYQGIQMRLANKGGKGSNKEMRVAFQAGYSEEGIDALRKQMQDKMKGMQVGSKEYLVQAQNLVDLNAFENLLKTAVQNGIQLDPAMLESYFEAIDDGAFKIKPAVSDEAWATLVDTINEKLKELNLDPIELDVKTGGVKELQKDVAKTTDHVAGAAQAFEALGNAMGQIEDPGAKVAGLVAQAIGSIAAGYGQAVAQAGNGSAGGPWGWIAFAISGLATMISVIAGVKSATAGNFAEGGIIPGNSYSGDNMRVFGLNSGEVVLNHAQQSNLASQLEGGVSQNIVISGKLSGRDILLAANNDNRSRGGQRGFYSEIH